MKFSSRHPENLKALAKRLGERASTGTSKEAAAFGEVLLVSVPYHALPALGLDAGGRAAGTAIDPAAYARFVRAAAGFRAPDRRLERRR